MDEKDYNKDDFVHRMLVKIQHEALEHRRVTDNIHTEVRFLRNHLFAHEDENVYWRNRMAEMQDELKSVIARIERLEEQK